VTRASRIAALLRALAGYYHFDGKHVLAAECRELADEVEREVAAAAEPGLCMRTMTINTLAGWPSTTVGPCVLKAGHAGAHTDGKAPYPCHWTEPAEQPAPEPAAVTLQEALRGIATGVALGLREAEPAAVCVCGHVKEHHSILTRRCTYAAAADGPNRPDYCPCPKYRARAGSEER
jgi:hypothetical protein